MKKILICAIFLICLLGCASNNVNNQPDEETIVFSGPGFEDWRYKGFGQELPLWFFFAYEDDLQGVVNSREDLAGTELSDLEIIAGNALNADQAEQLIKQNLELLNNEYIDTFWAKLCAETEEEQNPYCWVILKRNVK